MVDIIDHYLSHTRGSARQYTATDLNSLIRETLRLLEPMFRQHHVQATTQLTDVLPPLCGDGASLQRVFINLLNNAVDAMENGGTVTLTTSVAAAVDSGHPRIIAEVTDTGSGIAPEMVPRIFELFVTTKAPGKGTGLGLAVCQEIVKAHGGEIHLKSTVSQGTSVQLVLPTKSTCDKVRATRTHHEHTRVNY